MEFTGERMIPEHNKKDLIYAEHIARYFFASQFVGGKRVLDIACGSGYGSRYLADRGAASVCGVDNSSEAIEYAKKIFGKTDIEFIVSDANKLPFRGNEFDIIVSFETIEHIKDQEKFLAEAKRVLKKDGVLIISTPNASVFPKGNAFHVKELTLPEFKKVLAKHFKNLALYFQHNVIASYVFSEEELPCSDAELDIRGLKIPAWDKDKNLYAIGVAGDADLPKITSESAILASDKEIKLKDEVIAAQQKKLEMIYKSRIVRILRFFHRLRRSMTSPKKHD